MGRRKAPQIRLNGRRTTANIPYAMRRHGQHESPARLRNSWFASVILLAAASPVVMLVHWWGGRLLFHGYCGSEWLCMCWEGGRAWYRESAHICFVCFSLTLGTGFCVFVFGFFFP